MKSRRTKLGKSLLAFVLAVSLAVPSQAFAEIGSLATAAQEQDAGANDAPQVTAPPAEGEDPGPSISVEPADPEAPDDGAVQDPVDPVDPNAPEAPSDDALDPGQDPATADEHAEPPAGDDPALLAASPAPDADSEAENADVDPSTYTGTLYFGPRNNEEGNEWSLFIDWACKTPYTGQPGTWEVSGTTLKLNGFHYTAVKCGIGLLANFFSKGARIELASGSTNSITLDPQDASFEDHSAALRVEKDLAIVGEGTLRLSAGTSGGPAADGVPRDCVGLYADSLTVTQSEVWAQGGRAGTGSKTGVEVLHSVVLDSATLHAEDGSGGYGFRCQTLEMRSAYTAPAELDARGSEGIEISREPKIAGSSIPLGNPNRDGEADQRLKYSGNMYLMASTSELAKHVNIVSSPIANHSLYMGRVNGKIGLYCDRNLTVPYNPPRKCWGHDNYGNLYLSNLNFVTTAPVALECLEDDCLITVFPDTVNSLMSVAEGASRTAGIRSDHRVTIRAWGDAVFTAQGGNALSSGTTAGIEADEVVVERINNQTVIARGGDGGTSLGIKARNVTVPRGFIAEGGTAGLSVRDTLKTENDEVAVLGREDVAGDELAVAQHDRSSTYFQVNGKAARHIETGPKSASRLYFGPERKDASNDWGLFVNKELTQTYDGNRNRWSVGKRTDGTPELRLKGFTYLSSDEVALEVWSDTASPSGKVVIALAEGTQNLIAVERSTDDATTAIDAGLENRLVFDGPGSLEASSRTVGQGTASTGIRAEAIDVEGGATVHAQAWHGGASSGDICVGVRSAVGGDISDGTLHATGDSSSMQTGRAFGPTSLVKAQGRADRTSGDLTEAHFNKSLRAYEGEGGTNRETYISSLVPEGPLYFAPKDRAHPEGDWTLYTDAAYASEYPASARWSARGNTLRLNGFTYRTEGTTALSVYDAPAEIAFEGQNALAASGPADREDAAAIKATAPLVITGSEGATLKAVGTAGNLTRRKSSGIAAGELTLRNANVEALGARSSEHGTGYGIQATGLTVSRSTVDARDAAEQGQAMLGFGLHVSKTAQGKGGLLKVERSKIYAQGRSGAVYAEVAPDIPYQQTVGTKELGSDDFIHAIYSPEHMRYLAQDAYARRLRIGDTASDTLYFGPLNRNPDNEWSLFTDAQCTKPYDGKNWKANGKTLELSYFSYYTTANTALYLYDGATVGSFNSVVASVGAGPGQKRGIKAESDFTFSGNATLEAFAAPTSMEGDSIGIEAHNILQTGGYLRAEAQQAEGGSSYGFRVNKYQLVGGGGVEALGNTAGFYSNEESEFRNLIVRGHVHRDKEEAMQEASYNARTKCYMVNGYRAQVVNVTEHTPGPTGPLYFGSIEGVWSLYTDAERKHPYTGSGWSVDGNALVLSNFEYTSQQTTALVIQGNATIRLKEGTSTIECRNSVSDFPTHAIEAPDGLTIEGDDRAVLEVKAETRLDGTDAAGEGTASAQDDPGSYDDDYRADDDYNAAVSVAGRGDGKNLVLKGGMLKVTAKGGRDRQLMHGVVSSGKTTFAGGSLSVSIEGKFAGNGLRAGSLSYEKGSFEGTSSGRGAFWVNTETTPFKDNVDILGGDSRDSQLETPRWDQYTHAIVINGNPCPYVRITSHDTPLYFGPRDDSQFNKWSLFTDPHYAIEYAGQRDAWAVYGTMLVLENFNLTTSHNTALEVKNDDDATVAAAVGSTNTLKSTANEGEESYGIHAWGPLEISGRGALNATGGSPGLGGESFGVKADQLKVVDTLLIASGRTAGVSASSEPAHNTLVWGSADKSGGQLKEAVWKDGRYLADGIDARYVRFSQFDPRGALYFGPEGNVPGNPWSLFANPSRTSKYDGEGTTWSVEGKNLKLNNFTYQTDGLVGLSVSPDPDAAITLQPGTKNTIRGDAWMDMSNDTAAALQSDGPLTIAGEGSLLVTAGGSWTRGNRYGIDAPLLTVTANDVTAIGDTAGVHANEEPAHPNLTVTGSVDRYGSNAKDVTWSEGCYLVGKTPARFVEFENNLAAAGLYFGGVGAEWSLYTDSLKTQEYPGKGVTWSAAGHTLTLKGVQFETWGETALTVSAADDAAIVLAPESVSAFKSTAKDAAATYGVYAEGSLTIGGSGSLIASGGEASDGGTSTGLFSLGALTVNGGHLLLEGGPGDLSVGLSALIKGTVRGGIVDAKGNTGGVRTFHSSGLVLENGVKAEGAVERDGEELKPAVYNEPSGYYQVDGANARHTRVAAPPNPLIAADPGLLAFGVQPVNAKSAEQRLRVSASELTADMTIEAPEGFTVTPAEGWSGLFGGELRVTFDPTENKSYGGVLWLRSEGAPDVPVVLTGEGRASVIVADPGLLAFGYQAVATKSAEQRVKVAASGLKSDMAIEAPDGFTVVPAEGWNPRTGGILRVTFDPLEAKSYGGMLWLKAEGTSGAVVAPVTLTGEGRETTVDVSAKRLSFGLQPVATKSAEQRVQVKASGLESDLEVSAPEGFTVVPADGWDAREGGTLRVTFDPVQAKPYGEMLTVEADGADATMVALAGEGREVAVAADPGLLAFGMQGVGTESETLTITVAASGLDSNIAFEAPEGFKVVPGDDWNPRSGGQLYVTFAPAEVKSYADVLWIGADGADAAPVALTGEGVTAKIEVAPHRLDFGHQTVNTKSAEKRVTVKAVGLSNDMTFETPEGFEIKPADNWNPRTGGDLRVTFSPASEKMYDGVLSIVSGTTKATPIALEGTGSMPTIVILPVFNEFGSQPVGTESAEQRIHVSAYNAQADLEIAVPAGFKVTKALNWNARTGGDLIARFAPTEAKSYYEELEVGSQGSWSTAFLTGQGRQSIIKATPEKLDFGGQPVGSASAAKLVEVSASSLGGDLTWNVPDGFKAEPAAGWNPRTGGTLRVTFAPDRATTYGGMLQIGAPDSGGAAASVALAGEGVSASIKADPGKLAFGPQPVGAKSAEQRVRVSASGLGADMTATAPDGFTVVPAEGWNPRTGGELRVTFDPTEAKAYGGMLRIEAGGAAALVALAGEGREAMVRATPDHLDFGNQAVGTMSAEQRVRVTASGLTGDLEVTAPAGFTAVPAEGWNDRTGGELRVTFNPTEARAYAADLLVSADGADGAAVALSGTGRTAAIAAMPGKLDFGRQIVGTKSAEQLVEVKAEGLDADMVVAAPDGFTVVPADGWSARTGGTLRVTFDPTEARNYGGVLSIDADGADAAQVALTGKGEAPSIAASPGRLAFGKQPVATKSAEQRVRVTASGLTGDLSYTAPGGFTVVPAEGWDARAGGELRVTFDPTEAKVYGGVLLIEADGGDAASVTLTGTGLTTAIAVSPGRLDFGGQAVATKSAEQLVRVSASGLASDLRIDVPDGFTVMEADGWDARTGGTLRVTFDPIEAKAYTGDLLVSADGADGAAVALAGEGRSVSIAATPSLVDFGNQAVATKSAEQLVQVTATGLTGGMAYAVPEGFTVVPAEGWSALTGGTLRVTFDPTEAKAYGGVLRLSADGADGAAVTLTGVGRSAAIAVDPGRVAFGKQPVGTKSAEQLVEVRASGLDQNMTYNVPDGFTVTEADGWSALTGGTLRITFDPTAAQSYSAVMWIEAEGADAAPVALTGEGVDAAIAADPGLLAFGYVPVDDHSAEQTLRVSAAGLSGDLTYHAPDGFTVNPADGWGARTGGTLRVTFDPTEAKSYGAVMWIEANGADSVPVTLTGQGHRSSVTVDPKLLEFDPQQVGTKSAEKLVRVTATDATSDLSLGDVPQGFTVTKAGGWSDQTGGTLRITFDPTDEKTYAAVLWVKAGGADAAGIALVGEGCAAKVAATPDRLAFGSQAVGTKSAERLVQVDASGLTDDLAVSAPDGFTVVPADGWDAREGGELRVTFDPTDETNYGGVLRIEAGGADAAEVALTGRGSASSIAATPGLAAFGFQPVGTKSAEQLVQVSASGLTSDLAFTAPDGFTVVPAAGWSAREGGTLRITFDPTEAKSYGAVMWIEADGADGVPVTLTGEGRDAAVKAVPGSLSFGGQAVGTKSAEQLVRVDASGLAGDLALDVPQGFTAVPAEGWNARTGGTLRVTFDPTVAKAYRAVMRIEADGTDGASVALSGEGRAAAISADPDLVAFGSQAVGTKSAERLVRVSASGLGHDLSFAAPDGFTVVPADGWDARAGGTLRITFDPTEAKAYGAVMWIEADGADGVPVTLTGEGEVPSIAASPTSLRFGKQPVGTKSAEQLVKVTASGLTGDLAFDAPEGFTVTPAEGWDARVGGTLRVTFDPTEARAYGGVLRLSADGGDAVDVALAGEGRESAIAVDPGLVAFGNQPVNTASVERTVKVAASGLAGDLAYTAPAGFTVTPDAGWDNRTGGTLRITFSPTEAKSYGAVMWVEADGADAAPVTLTGEGRAKAIAADPGLLAFGYVPVGEHSAEQTLHVSASGLSGQLKWQAPDGFTVNPADGWNDRTGGTLRVTFDPTESKSYGAVMWIEAEGADSAPVTLTGQGHETSIVASPTLLEFDAQQVGTKSAEKLVRVTASDTTSDLVLEAPQGFTVTPAEGWDDQTGGTLRVTFDPTDEKTYGEVLWVRSGNDAAGVALVGEGCAARIGAEPGRLAFGSQAVGTKSAEQLVRVTASGLTSDLVLSAPDGFTAVPADGWDVREGGTLRVTFDPTDEKNYGGMLRIEAAGADAAEVSLTGRGSASSIAASPDLAAFGSQAVGTKSAERLVRVNASGLDHDMSFTAPDGFTVAPADGWDARTGGTLRITFDPTEAKSYGATMWIEADGADGAPVTLTGEGYAASIVTSPDLAAFGFQPVGTKSAERTVEVRASGLTSDLAFTAPDGFTVTPADGWSAREGGTLRITFDPTEAKSYGSVMWIEADGADGVPLTLTGEGRDAAVKAVPGSLSFGGQAVGTKSAEQLVKVDASGLTDDLSFDVPRGFTAVPAEGWDARTGGTLRVTFDPTEAKAYRAVMRIEADGADGALVQLAGEGRAAAISASPDLVAFGFQPVGTKSAEQLVQVSASGLDHDMNFTAPDGFTVTPAEGWDPLTGGTLRITFDPTEAKSYGAVMWVEADGADGMPISLTGEGRESAVKATPDRLSFGDQPVGTKSAEQLVQVAASGLTSDLSFGAPEGFTVTPAEGWNVRTGGTLRVTFDPTAAKAYSGMLWIDSDGADAAFVALTGQGRTSAIKAVPDRLLFDDQVVGTKSAEQLVRVDASGLAGDMAFDVPQGFTVVPAEGWDTRTGGELRVTFDPTEAKAYSEVLWINADGADGAPVALSGTGKTSEITASPTKLSFGFQPVGTKSDEQRILVKAAGLAADLSFEAPAGFTVVPAEGWDAREGGELRVTFDPTEAKDYGAVMWIGADGADAAPVVLAGEGRETAVKATPPALAFGGQPVGTKSAEQRVRVVASGLTSDLALDVPDGFTVVPAEGWDARTGGELRVTFDPTEVKEYGAVLSIESDGADAASVVLTGEGREQGIVASPDLLAFGFQPVASKSAEQRVRVQASGLTSDMSFEEPEGFTVVPAEGWDPRTGGELRITFDPLEAKAYGAVMWIESDGADAASVALTGEGRDLAVKVSEGLLAFGSQPVATKSVEKRVHVEASGLEGDLAFSAPAGFTVTPAEGWDARTGGELRVTFDPTEAKSYGEVMWIESDGADAAPVALTGEGREAGVKAAPELLAFGKQEVGTKSAGQRVHVQASGLSADLAFDVPAGFTVVPAEGWDPRAGGELLVTFDPTEVKTYGGVLWIGADGADAAPVALTGEGVKPAPPVPPKPKPTPTPTPTPKPPTPITGDGVPVTGLAAVALLAAVVAAASWLRWRRRPR
ncbi:choice-of-anchor D domain-containing protein [Arabiibacter massiliensis]|uniref:choice-of-anchor D domain-containing protein n=1 Tax=Arabiibacter massiliensis TaxID=1870985 RepID=UPI0009BB0524|nr:choice-of-anchor D domain-containing protein [Arabiibacter massiliensis]